MNAPNERAVFTDGSRDIESHPEARVLSFLVEIVHASARFKTTNGKVSVIPYYGGVGSSIGARKSLFRHYPQELVPREPGMLEARAS